MYNTVSRKNFSLTFNMSINHIKRRYQKDLTKLPKIFRNRVVKQNNMFTLPTFENSLPILPKEEHKTMTQTGYTEGDLVYITKGEHKGTISTIFRYSKEYDGLFLSDIIEKKIIPKDQWFDQQDSFLVDYPKLIPANSVKLAAKDKNEKGEDYYIVADEVVFKGKYYDDRYRKWLPRRFVKHHEHIEVPWPNPPTEPKSGELSTEGETVFEKTWEFQSLSVPPFPSSIVNELRNPHSKHKARVLTELQARRLNKPTMPLSKEQQIYLAKKEQNQTEKPTELAEEVQDFIGERIANHLNSITNPHMKAHLDALSKNTINH